MFEAVSNVGHKMCMAGDLVIQYDVGVDGCGLAWLVQAGLVSPSYAVYRQTRGSWLSRDYAQLMLRSALIPPVEYKRLSTGIGDVHLACGYTRMCFFEHKAGLPATRRTIDNHPNL